MFKLNLKIALRNLWKNKGYTLINIAGLSIGMASCILIFIFVRYQFSFDQQFENKDRIYRGVTDWKYSNGSVDGSQGVPIPFAEEMRTEFPQFEKVAAIQSGRGVIGVKDAEGKIRFKEESSIYYTQADFFDIFSFTWLSGKPHEALAEPNTVALSKEKAALYFGDWQKALGKTIVFKKNVLLKVTGIFDDQAANTSLPLKIVVSYPTFARRNLKSWSWVSSSSECYLLLKEGINIHDLDAALVRFHQKVYKKSSTGDGNHHSFQPLKDIHNNSTYGNFAGKTMAKKELYGLIVIGAFLLLTACINFINLATAQAVNRSKEVGVRKVLGSDRRQLVMQFLGETITITVIAVLIACVLTEMALPYLKELFNEEISFSLLKHPVIFLFLLVLVILVSFLAGFYPALIMSGFSPALAIKNKVTVNSGGMGLRQVLVVVQFAITIILIISTLIVLKQMNYLRQKPLGFNPDAVALVSVPDDSLSKSRYDNFKTRLLSLPGVMNVSYFDTPPSSQNVSETNFYLNGKEVTDFQVRTMSADMHYFETFGLELVAGKPLPKSDTTNAYIVNETFLKKVNISAPEEALGKLLKINNATARIVGVAKDFNDKSLHEEITPIAISSDKASYYNMAVKMESKRMLEVMKEVKKLWDVSFPDDVYSSNFINDDLNEYYDTERVMGILFRVFSGVIIFISFIGLFGLISFVASQRTREVAIRKVLGASNFELVKMLNGSFLLMVFFANVVAWPLAYFFVRGWLNGFAYRIELSIWPFVVAMFISMVTTLVTVSLRSYRAARTNPIDALKYE
ncbi:ABC transporter permease [Pedobacter sp. AW31-3R]|uniref:ABC transporter permease n=1 Tax=Pedobacter sp. AW31-3R TaxID=3445781 RepID=UPI003F9FCFFD